MYIFIVTINIKLTSLESIIKILKSNDWKTLILKFIEMLRTHTLTYPQNFGTHVSEKTENKYKKYRFL